MIRHGRGRSLASGRWTQKTREFVHLDRVPGFTSAYMARIAFPSQNGGGAAQITMHLVIHGFLEAMASRCPFSIRLYPR